MPSLGPDVDDLAPDESVAQGMDQQGKAGERLSPARLYLRRFLRNRGAVAGLVIFALLTLLALAGGVFTDWDHREADFTALSLPPGAEGHLLGTNQAGNDTYAQLVHGLGRSLIIALTVSLLTNEGAPLTLSYATGKKGVKQAHSGAQVPISAEGPGAAAVKDLEEQTQLFGLVSRLLGLDTAR